MKKRLPISQRTQPPVQHITPKQQAGYRFAILIILAMFLILGLVGFTFMIASLGSDYKTIELDALNGATQSQGFTFPTSQDTLEKGQTYTLKWSGGPPTIEAMYLVNRALQKEGVSVAIADRAFNVENTGSYEFTIPTNIPSGQYQIQAGTLSSDYFEIQ